MTSLNVDIFQQQFSSFLSKVEAGEEIILERLGQPIAKVTPIKRREKRILGREMGKIWMSDDFTDPLPAELLAEFYK
jgi:antitoxin (DNA-binding transcriptional repressor) of toxin-antitoxin stability system